jgi:hypothetical protein
LIARPRCPANRQNAAYNYSDKGKAYRGFNAGLSMAFSEWVVDFLANHRPLDEAARRIDVLKAEIALADSL